MTLSKITILSLFLFIPALVLGQLNRLTVNEKDYFINGINIPWNSFGTDIGTHDEWGALYDPDWFENFFSECQNYGVNTARLWVHADGRSTPEFDSLGYVIGLDDNFFENLDDIFAKAEAHNVMLLLCLWSFDMMKNRTDEAGQFAGIHGDLVTDISKTVSYIENALIPIVDRYANQCNLLGFEIINEPEWAIDVTQGAGTTESSTLEEMQRFVGLQAAAIHTISDKMVTLGSVGLMFNSTTPPAVANFWSDESLEAATSGNANAFLDFYQIHYWDWMPAFFDPFVVSSEAWNLDKPVLIGESPAKNDGVHTVEFMVNESFENNYAGIMPWSYWGMDGEGNWEDAKMPLLAMRDLHADEIDFSCFPTFVFENTDILPFSIYPNPTKGDVFFNDPLFETALEIQISNLTGQIVFQSENLEDIDISSFNEGVYFLQVLDANERLLHKEKLLKTN
ncbi:MAG: T9SS type A sorting domain-containing protein [Bacteroidetes bacterium]|jgi:hypothetical protein|nr:T9SS type A sorting domain-containing protein [Bacteroidota bacterium]MDF1864089.1 T9SS type A sorting domain-containing protein [Saprospiraceae bacterium]